MGDAPQEGGFILLWRSLKDNDHLQMPEIPFKLFIYLLLQVNRFPAKGCSAGEGWITYQMIAKACCKPGKLWADSTISKALDYLEGDNADGPDGEPEVYIRRIKEPGKRAQRIQVINYEKHQPAITSLKQAFGTNCDQTTSPEQVVALGKQQCIEDKEEEKGVGARVRTVKPENRNTWGRAYQDLFILAPKATFISDIERLMRLAGMKDNLIVAVMEAAVRQKGKNPQGWTLTTLSGLASHGIMTAEEWVAFETKPVPSPTGGNIPEEDEVTRTLRELARRDNNSIQ